MSESEIAKFTCPGCGKQYRWSERVAGKQAKCSCGQTINVPAKSPLDLGDEDVMPEFGSYDVAENETTPPPSLKPLPAAARVPSRVPAMPAGGVPFKRRDAAAASSPRKSWDFNQIEVTLPLLMLIGGMAGIALAIAPIWMQVIDGDKTIPRGVLQVCYIIEAVCILCMLGGVGLQLYHMRDDERPNGQSMVRWTLIRIVGGLMLCVVGTALIATLAHFDVPRRPAVWFGGIPLFIGVGIIARTFAPNM